MRFFKILIFIGMANAYPKGNAICDAGRRMSCRFCVDACGTQKCGADPDPAEYRPDNYPECVWACWCEEGFVWSSFHYACIEGEYDAVCNGPNYYTMNVIPEYRQTYRGWEKVPGYTGGYSEGGYKKK